jgi:diguanylate cyclase (GGDEF)-like protein
MQQKHQSSRGFPLRLILIAPFVIQIVAAIGITGWLSYQNGQRAVSELASGVLVQAKYRVKERLDRLLNQAQVIVQDNTFAYQQDKISLNRMEELQGHFWQQILRHLPSPQSIYVGDTQGQYLLVNSSNQLELVARNENQRRTIFKLDKEGNRQQSIKIDQYDPRSRPWYQQAKQQSAPIWTETYWFASGGYGITTAQAIRDRNGQLLGVAAVDLGLGELDAYLRTIKISRASSVFIIERSGRLISTDSDESEANSINTKKILQSINAADSQDSLIRESTKHLQKVAGNFQQIEEPLSLEFSSQNQRHFLSVLPYRYSSNLDWLVMIVVPEQDFIQQVEDNHRTTLLLTGISLFLSIAVGMLTSRSLMQSISRLTEATDEVAQGNWKPQIISKSGSQEMNVLVNSFDSMVDRLQGVFNRLENFAYIDNLTGLPNRAAFHAHLQEAITLSKQATPEPFAVLLLELDSFKLIENGLGPVTADLLLKGVAARLHECLQRLELKTLIISRLERDEFAILLRNIAGENIVVDAAQSILQSFQQPFHLEQQAVLTSASIGAIVNPATSDLPEEIMRNVNLAKFSAKTAGKERYVIFDDLMRKEATERLQLAADLQYAITHEELELWYQPIFTLNPERIVSFEALVRWRHPTAGMISPIKFIPIAEETGIIVSIGIWIMRTACAQMRVWQEQFPTFQTVTVSVNVSAQQLLLPDFANQVEQILQETGLEGRYLQLEITESAAVSQPSSISQKLMHLQTLGVKICIDDFGTGYSHLSHLLQLPIDILKIDRSFVGGIDLNPKNAEIAKTILALASCLGIEAIAEGVETTLQLEQLQSLECRKFQGYLFAKPMSTDLVMQAYLEKPEA